MQSSDLGPKLWSTPVSAAKWSAGLVGMILLMIGCWIAWDLETSGTIFVRGFGRIPAGDFIWGYRLVMAIFLSFATGLASAWYWFPKVDVFEHVLVLPDGRRVLWSEDLRCEQSRPGKWVFQQDGDRIGMLVYDALSIKRMKAELESRGLIG